MTMSQNVCHWFHCVKNVDFGMDPPQYEHFFPHVSRSLLCIRNVAIAFRTEEEVSWRRGPPVTYFCPALDPPLDGSGRKTTTLVRDLEHFIHTKFHQNPSSGSGEEVENVNSLNGRRTTDGRRTDGRRTTRDHNRSLEPIGSCALKTRDAPGRPFRPGA